MTSESRLERKLDGETTKKNQLWKIVGYDYRCMNIAIECPDTGDRLLVSLLDGQEYHYNSSQYEDPPKDEATVDNNKDDKEFYISAISSSECYCGNSKKFGFVFCFKCFQGLSPKMLSALYKHIGNGFEKVYEDACKYLQVKM